MTYTIKEASEKTGISVHTLRYYDKQGLFPAMERTDARYRMFSENELEEIRLIHCFKAAGLQIKEIKTYMDLIREGDSALQKRLDYMKAQYERIENQRRELELAQKMIRFKIAYYEGAIRAGSEKLLTPDIISDEDRAGLAEALAAFEALSDEKKG